jgi:hypothetical protein
VTPPAATVAGRRRATGMRPASRSSRIVRGRTPRRVSGPARPAPRAAASRPAARPAAPAGARPIAAFGGRLAAAAAAALPLPATNPAAPSRRRPQPVPRPARRPDLPLGARALAWVRALPDHRLLDRLIGGRIWIVLLGTLLVGIVTMQLSLLRLNAGIGRAVEQTGALQQSNSALRGQISQLSNSESIVAQATQIGFVTPPQGSPRFLSASGADAGKALSTMRVPDPATAAAVTTSAATTDPGATTDPATTTPTDTTATDTTPAATVPAVTTVTPTQATGTTTPASGTAAPATTSTPVAGGASAPVGPQG